MRWKHSQSALGRRPSPETPDYKEYTNLVIPCQRCKPSSLNPTKPNPTASKNHSKPLSGDILFLTSCASQQHRRSWSTRLSATGKPLQLKGLRPPTVCYGFLSGFRQSPPGLSLHWQRVDIEEDTKEALTHTHTHTHTYTHTHSPVETLWLQPSRASSSSPPPRPLTPTGRGNI